MNDTMHVRSKVPAQEEKRQFFQLVGHFLNRFFDNDLIAPQVETRVTVIHILAILAVPGLLISFQLIRKYAYLWAKSSFTPSLVAQGLFAPDLVSSSVDKCFFISFSMVIMGFIAVLEWDALLPDRRDYAILIPLPIQMRTLCAAKVTALVLFLGVFSVAINAGSTVVFPIVAMTTQPTLSYMVWYLMTHAASVFAGNAFIFFFCVSLQSLLMNLFGYRCFKQISRYLQLLLMFLLLSVFFLFPKIFSSLEALKQNELFTHLFPPMWFLGLYETLLGKNDPVFHSLAAIAVCALALTLMAFLLTYVISYKRQVRRALEAGDDTSPKSREIYTLLLNILNRFVVRNPAERAAFHFVAKTMIRSQRHRLFLGAYIGVGLALAVVGLVALFSGEGYRAVDRPSSALLSIPLVLSFFILVGMRVIFTIPAELRANWIFKLTEGQDRMKCYFGAYKAMFLLAMVPLFSLLLAFYLIVWGWPTVLLHLTYAVTLSLILTELLMFKFQKIPFTCSYLPGKANLKLLCLIYLFAFTTYAYTMTELESWMLQNPMRFAFFYGVAFPLLIGWITYRNRLLHHGLTFIYEEEPDPAVLTLDLSH